MCFNSSAASSFVCFNSSAASSFVCFNSSFVCFNSSSAASSFVCFNSGAASSFVSFNSSFVSFNSSFVCFNSSVVFSTSNLQDDVEQDSDFLRAAATSVALALCNCLTKVASSSTPIKDSDESSGTSSCKLLQS